MSRVGALLLLAVMAAAPLAHADESFDVSAYEKKAFEFGGYLELRPEQQWLRTDSAGYALQFPGSTRTSTWRLLSAAELDAVARYESLSFLYSGRAAALNTPDDSTTDSVTLQAYGAWQIDPSSKAEIGKRALLWGTGYAFNPVGFLQRPKDPFDPDLSRQGYVLGAASYVRSLDGPLQTVALTAVVLPTHDDLNSDFGPPGHANPAIKLYGLLYDTDIDLIWAGRGSRGPRFGIDFARNLGSNLEIHGELARNIDSTRIVLGPGNALEVQTQDTTSALIGLRYLTASDLTIIFELYRNGGGYGADELSAFYDGVRQSAGNPALANLVRRAAAQGYGRPNPGRRYAYLRLSQKEPFDILNLTPALTLIANVDDASWSLIPEVVYGGVENFEFRLRLALNVGDTDSEFGEKAVQTRLELRARWYF